MKKPLELSRFMPVDEDAGQGPSPARAEGPPKRLSVVLDEETYRALRIFAMDEDRTHQSIIEEAVQEYLRKRASA